MPKTHKKMIQRIQSIYLLLSALFMGGLFLKQADLLRIDTTLPTSLSDMTYFNDKLLDIYDQNLLMVFTALVILFSLVAIFLFRKRKIQITLSRVSMLVVLLFLILVIYISYADLQSLFSSTNITPGWGFALPFLSIILLVLAVRSIRKDDKLVKSMDRLR